eukprot:6201622-Pleurochrysis_carterae.AAC.1
MMNWARIQMKTWIPMKNEHKANVQRSWDNRGKTHKAFQRWRKRCGMNMRHRRGGKEDGEKGKERERTYGIKYWGRVGCQEYKPQKWVP